MRIFVAILLTLTALSSKAQVYESFDSDISFFSEAPFQDVEASNHEVVSYFDESTGYVLFDLMIESFEFDQGLMQQHFNDRYLESDDYPKAEFFGKVYGYDPSSQEVQEVTAMGELTIHGVTNAVKSHGKMMKTPSGDIHLLSKFTINIEDFAVDTPRLLFHPVAETVQIKVEAQYHLTGS